MSIYPNLDPELATILEGVPTIDLKDVEAARALTGGIGTAPIAAVAPGVEITTIMAPGLDGAPDVPIRFIRPADASGPLAVLVAMHGGGFVLSRAQDFDYFCVEAVRTLGIAVAGVEYRLAPETPYPGPLDDCIAVLRHLHEHSDALNVDPHRIAVGGSSAGGGLAAGLALRVRDEGGPAIAFQLLLSPAVDDRLLSHSMNHFVDSPVVTRETALNSWRHYLGEGYPGPDAVDVPPYAVPRRARDLSGLPPAYIAVMEIDPLRDDNLHYARDLLHAGVGVELHLHRGAVHGTAEFAPHSAIGERIVDGLIDALARGLGVPRLA
ncbi:alpha/beta hydrolase [Microbacterium tumbae]